MSLLVFFQNRVQIFSRRGSPDFRLGDRQPMSINQIQIHNTTRNLLFLMIANTDHITGATGKSPIVSVSKNGAAFITPSGAVSEVGFGLYYVAAVSGDANTLGPLELHAEATGCDPTDTFFEVVDYNPDDRTQFLKIDLSAVTGESSHSVINALRFLRNKWSLVGTTLTVYAEDGVSIAWQETVTATPGANPITSTSG